MGIVTSTTCRSARRALFAVTALLVAAVTHAQSIQVVDANSTNDRVFGVNFGKNGITTTLENTDSSTFGSIQALAFFVNPSTTALDLIVADNTGGKIAVYPGDFTNGAPTTSTVIWRASQGGPAAPNGLSVDLAGDLFVVNTSGGAPQLWVFPAATGSPASCPTGLTPLSAYPALCGSSAGSPVLLDSNFAAGQVLVDTAIVPAAPSPPTGSSNLANTGDLLVVTSNPATVLDYALTFSSSGLTFTRTTLPVVFPAGTTPGGLAFWPFGSSTTNASLLITGQNTNTILRYSCCSSADFTAMTAFSGTLNLGGSGLQMYKIKTGYQSGAALAFIAQAGSDGHLLEFGEGSSPSGPGTLLATIAPKGNHPQGLAVINAGFAAANTCNTLNGCNPTGLLNHLIPAANNGAPPFAENVCIVTADPRVSGNVDNGTWSCNGQALPVNQVCKGFDSTGHMVIPGYLCGQSGDSASSMQGFTLIKTLTDDSKINGVVVDNAGTVPDEPTCPAAGPESPPGSNPPLAAGLWAPLANEGIFIADGLPSAANPTIEMLEATAGCGTVHHVSTGGSISGVGFAVNLPGVTPEGTNAPSPGGALGTLGDNKYQDLESQIETILVPAATVLPTVAAQLAAVTAGGNVGCVYLSQSYFDIAQLESGNPTQQLQDYNIAADLLSNADTSNNPITCDSIVTFDLQNVPNAFVPTNGPPPVYNPSGHVRSRLAHLYFLINTRILGNPPNNTDTNPPTPAWPPVPAPLAPPSGFTPALPPAQDIQNPCVATTSYPPPGGCPALTLPASVQAGTAVTASFTLYGSNNAPTGCTLSSTDGTFNGMPAQASSPATFPFSGQTTGTVPAATAPGNYTYTLSCPFPNTASAPPVTVAAVLNVLPPPVQPTITAAATGSSVTVSWTLGSFSNCALSSTDGAYNNVSTTTLTTPLTYIPSVPAGTPITYSLACMAPSAASVTATATVTQPAPITVSVSPGTITDDSQKATISWTAPSGASSCKLTDSSTNRHGVGGRLSGTTSSSGAGSFTATYTSGESDGGFTITFTASCTGATSQNASLHVTE